MISNPFGSATYGYGLNDSGTIVGSYENASDIAVGFTVSNGVYYDVSTPDTGALPVGVSTSGIIVGYYYDSNDTPWGFIVNGTTYTTVTIAGRRKDRRRQENCRSE